MIHVLKFHLLRSVASTFFTDGRENLLRFLMNATAKEMVGWRHIKSAYSFLEALFTAAICQGCLVLATK